MVLDQRRMTQCEVPMEEGLQGSHGWACKVNMWFLQMTYKRTVDDTQEKEKPIGKRELVELVHGPQRSKVSQRGKVKEKLELI